MKKALTLIELIFTIVIIAFVFTVIPKIIYVSNKTLAFSKKEDAIFNMMAKMMDISLKEYDENNTLYDDILLANNPPVNVLDCNSSSGYRVGRFKGSRNCKNGIFESDIGIDSDDNAPDDVDDYNSSSYNEENTTNGHTVYTLKIEVGYTDEWQSSDYNNKNLDYKFSSTSNNTHTNVKRIHITVSKGDENISSLSYYSSNIGHVRINGVSW